MERQNPINLIFRKATIEDAPFVATVMMEAVEIPMMEDKRTPEDHLVSICQRTDTLYSWQNATIAEVDGVIAGGLIAYEGEGYHDVKVRTFAHVKDFVTFDVDKMDDETQSGEYYLDSLAVLPEWRGKGVGSSLLMRGIEIAQSKNLTPVLACDPDNTRAFELYRNLGFESTGKLFIFGEWYVKMVWRT